MKRTLIIFAGLISWFLLSSTSCSEDEPFVQVKPFESAIYNEIKAHREANGLTGPFVQQFIMVREAQLHSTEMAATQTLDTTGIAVRWDEVHNKIGGTNEGLIITSTNLPDAATIVDGFKSDSATNALLLENYTQCGVGVTEGLDGLNYITVMMMLVEN